MFRDAKEELARLERELLAEEEPEVTAYEADNEDTPEDDWEDYLDTLLDDPDDFGEEHPGIYQNYSNGYGRNQPSHYDVYNTDQTDEDLEEFSEAVQEPKESSTGFTLTVCLLLLAIAGVLFYMVLNFL